MTPDEKPEPGTQTTAAPTRLANEIFAGSTAAFVSIPLGLAIGTLAFGPLGPDYLNDGARAGLIAGAFGGLLTSLLQTRSFVVSTTSSATGLIIAAFATQLIGDMGLPPHTVASVFPALVITAGLITVLLGLAGLGRAVAFTPQPIFAGFVSGVGILILLSQGPKLLGFGRWSALAEWLGRLGPTMIPRTACAIALVALMLWLGRRRPKLPNVAIGFIVGTALHHLFTILWPALDLGPTIGAMPGWTSDSANAAKAAFDPAVLPVLAAHWRLILATALPLALVLSLESMMARRLAESLAEIPRAPMRNLAATGLGCIASGLAGGIAVSGSPAQVMANYRAGGRGPVSATTVALALIVLIIAFPSFTALVPASVPSAVLIVIGFRLIDSDFVIRLRSALAAREPEPRRRAGFDLVVFLVVMLPTAMGEIILGVALGIVMSVTVFLIRMGRPVVRRRSYGDTRLSKRVRCTSDAAKLARHGGETMVLELEGVLFFGNADALALALSRASPRCRQVVLDMRRISDIDSTGASILAQAIVRTRQNGCDVVICSVGAMLHSLYSVDTGALRIFPDLDTALEWTEDRLLAHHGRSASQSEGIAIEDIDMCADLLPGDIAILRRHLTQVSYAPGEVICREGEPADRLWILTSGSVSIRANETSSRRIIALGPGTTVGEMALIEGGLRSATAIADEAVEAQLLTAEGFATLLREHPRLANRMMHNLARELVRRLRNATQELARGA